MYCSTVYKTSRQSPLGLRLWAAPDYKSSQRPYSLQIVIAHIDDHGLFAGKLKTGMRIDSINHMYCADKGIEEVQNYLDNLMGIVRIVASAPNRPTFQPEIERIPCLAELSDDDESLVSALSQTSVQQDEEEKVDNCCNSMTQFRDKRTRHIQHPTYMETHLVDPVAELFL